MSNLPNIEKNMLNIKRPSYPSTNPIQNSSLGNVNTRFQTNQKLRQKIIGNLKQFKIPFNRPDELVDKSKELPSKRQKRSHPSVNFADLYEPNDLVGTLIRRIVYAEGDVIKIENKTVEQLKVELKHIVNLLLKKEQG